MHAPATMRDLLGGDGSHVRNYRQRPARGQAVGCAGLIEQSVSIAVVPHRRKNDRDETAAAGCESETDPGSTARDPSRQSRQMPSSTPETTDRSHSSQLSGKNMPRAPEEGLPDLGIPLSSCRKGMQQRELVGTGFRERGRIGVTSRESSLLALTLL
jgi:hypothetical protein